MKKCIIMFVFLVLALALAVWTDNHGQVVKGTNYAVNEPPTEMLLAKVQNED